MQTWNRCLPRHSLNIQQWQYANLKPMSTTPPTKHLPQVTMSVMASTCSYFMSSFCVNMEHHYSDVIMGAIVSQITSLRTVYLTVYSGADQRKHQSSASLAFVRGIHWMIGEFLTQRASNAENVSIWWHHHDEIGHHCACACRCLWG